MTDPTSRALRLLGLLESRRTWTGGELAAELGVTDRTLRRDITRLRELGYTVEADAGSGGGYSLGRGQIVPPLLLEDDEATAITLALMTAIANGTAGDTDAVLRALGKLDDLLPSALRTQLRELRRHIDVLAQSNATDLETLLQVAKAVRRQVRLRFTYTDRAGAITTRAVEPHQITARGRLWLVTSYDLDRQAWRTFRLDRMSTPEATTWTFKPRAGLAEALASAREPTPASAYQHQIVVLVECSVDRLREIMPDESAQFTALPDGRTEYRTGGNDPGQAAWWLSRLPYPFGVVADDAVRDAVASLAARLTAATVRPTAAAERPTAATE